MTILNINGTEYVERTYKGIIYSEWSPKAYVLGVASGILLCITFIVGLLPFINN